MPLSLSNTIGFAQFPLNFPPTFPRYFQIFSQISIFGEFDKSKKSIYLSLSLTTITKFSPDQVLTRATLLQLFGSKGCSDWCEELILKIVPFFGWTVEIQTRAMCIVGSALLKEVQPVAGERHQRQPGALNAYSSITTEMPPKIPAILLTDLDTCSHCYHCQLSMVIEWNG